MKRRNVGSEAFAKVAYDGARRMKALYIACNPDAEDYSEAGNVDGDTVLEQLDITYDHAGNAVFEIYQQRNHDATGLGHLKGPNGDQPEARASYMIRYPDALGRIVATANYGTNGGTAITPPGSTTIPAPSDTILVAFNSFNSRGDLFQITDPAGTVTHQQFDDAARLAQMIENYRTSGSGPDIKKTTGFTYNPDGKLSTLTAANSVTGDQKTQWTYGSSVADSGLASFALLHSKTYPEGGVVQYAYNCQGQLKKQTDQRGVVREFLYDKLGRLVHDCATTIPSGVDSAVKRISRIYEVRGLLEIVTSADSSAPGAGTILNQVQLAYDGFSQLLNDFQSHAGAVDTSTTPNVGYTYADGSDNTARLESITYPNGRALNFAYGRQAATTTFWPDFPNQGRDHASCGVRPSRGCINR